MKRARGVVMTVLVALSLVACTPTTAPSVTGDSLTDARAHFDTFMAAVADVQAVIHDDAWRTTMYGDVPKTCTLSTYRFTMRRDAPAEDGDVWRIPGGVQAMQAQVAEHLTGAGWNAVETATAGRAASMTATNRDAGVAHLTVLLHPGKVTDTADVTAESSCFDGDSEKLNADLFDGSLDIDRTRYPTAEKPGDPPRFGYPTD